MKIFLKKNIYVLIIILIFNSCSVNQKKNLQQFNPYIEAFTSGTISRFSPIRLVFTQKISADKQSQVFLQKNIKFYPNIKGKFSVSGDDNIEFIPDEELKRNSEYQVKINLNAFYNIDNKEYGRFYTYFKTLPLACRINLDDFSVNDQDDNAYDLTFTITSADKETSELIESLPEFSEKVSTEWTHNNLENKHEVKIKNVSASDKERFFSIKIPSSKLQNKQCFYEVKIPAKNYFGVQNVEMKDHCVVITFTKNIDQNQDIGGLISVGEISAKKITIDGNKITVYLENDQSGKQNLYINRGIKSVSGMITNKNSVYTIDANKDVPEIEILSKGNIMPISDGLKLPFRARYMRGVKVKVIKIGEKNIGQFLQVNRIDESSELKRVGRIIASDIIFIDNDKTVDLSHPNTFAIDLNSLINVEAGAIYRIELSMPMELSVYPGANPKPLTNEEIMQKNKQDIIKDGASFDNAYYYYDDFDFDAYYDYNERENPLNKSFYTNKTKSKNILATDLGLLAKAAEDNKITVFVNNIVTAKPMSGVDISIFNYQNQKIASDKTDSDGKTEIKTDETKGKPYYIKASYDKQRAYLRVDNATSLSMSAFDVSGEEIEKGIKGFIYGERGVWRPGDTINLSFILCDRVNELSREHPIIMELYTPIGQIYAKRISSAGLLGLYTFRIPTGSEAPTGIWKAKIYVGGRVFSKNIRIETIKPNRLKIDLKFRNKILYKNKPLNANLHVEWQQGAVAQNLKYDIQCKLYETKTKFDNYAKFNFDDPAKSFSTEESNAINGQTDQYGNATVEKEFTCGNNSPGMLNANVITRVYEESGDFSIDAYQIKYSPYTKYVGIASPQNDKHYLDTDKKHIFDIVSVDANGNPQANTNLQAEIYKVEYYWWWNSDKSNLAQYISQEYNKPVSKFNLKTNKNGKANLPLLFKENEWGTYYIRVTDTESKHSTGLLAFFDYPYNDESANEMSDAATILSIKTDKTNYVSGEKMTITFPSSEGAYAIVSIENGSGILHTTTCECKDKQTSVKIDITPEMQPNAYVNITLLQKYQQTKNERPIRLYGVIPVFVTDPEKHLNPEIKMADEIRPQNNYEITISEKSGKQMSYTLAIVDEGLLDLTRFKTPDPWAKFNAREALGVRTWDFYNYILGAYGGKIEQLFGIGGDSELESGKKAIVNRFKPVVTFAGPFILKKGEKKKHRFFMPNYSGRVRAMIVAGNGNAYGSTEKSIFVRKPIMLLGTLPRIIGTGDEMSIPATVFATQDNIGDVTVSIKCSQNMEIVGNSSLKLNFTHKDDKTAMFRIKVKDVAGTGKVTLYAKSATDKASYETEIKIRMLQKNQTQTQNFVVEQNKKLKIYPDAFGKNGTNTLSAEVSNMTPINISSRIKYLIDYPHGCLEQIVSKAFPQLYLPKLISLTAVQKQEAETNVKTVIEKLRLYQTAEGAFSYWASSTNTNAWGTIYAVHFMHESENLGFDLPTGMKNKAIKNLSLVANKWNENRNAYNYVSEQITQAYRLFILAIVNSPEIGAMNRFKNMPNTLHISNWLLAGAYAAIGRKDVATEIMQRKTDAAADYSNYDETYGSAMRDEALMLQILCLMDKNTDAQTLAQSVSQTLASNQWLSTQTTAMGLCAISKFLDKYGFSQKLNFTIKYNGKNRTIDSTEPIWSEILEKNTNKFYPIEIKNTSSTTIFVKVISDGIPNLGEEIATSNGIGLNVVYANNKGEPININCIKQGTSFKAIATVKNATTKILQNLVLKQIFPAGWEILNTRYTGENNKDDKTYQDIRDDRIYSYIDNLPVGKQITVTINLCAIYKGMFFMPPVECELMYNNKIRANTKSRFVNVE